MTQIPKKKAGSSWKSLLFAIGILLTTIVPMLAYKHYIAIPDFWLGFVIGTGIILMSAVVILLILKARANGPSV
jgi:hypothetical protein